MSNSSTGTSFLVSAWQRVGSRPIRCVCSLPIKKNCYMNYFCEFYYCLMLIWVWPHFFFFLFLCFFSITELKFHILFKVRSFLDLCYHLYFILLTQVICFWFLF